MLAYDWPPQRGTSGGLAIVAPSAEEVCLSTEAILSHATFSTLLTAGALAIYPEAGVMTCVASTRLQTL